MLRSAVSIIFNVWVFREGFVANTGTGQSHCNTQ
jgi:citrate lyase alpha subunit